VTGDPRVKSRPSLKITSTLSTPRIPNFSLAFVGDDAIIIDGIAPYRWLNPNAPVNLLADVEKSRKPFQVTSEHLSDETGFWNVEGSHAYAIISATLMVTAKAQTAAWTGTLAYTFSKHGEARKIDAQARACTS
jgi:hypothetical protein